MSVRWLLLKGSRVQGVKGSSKSIYPSAREPLQVFTRTLPPAAPYHSDIFMDGVSHGDTSRFRKSIMRGGTGPLHPASGGIICEDRRG